jgi:hypothetical protein
VLPEDDQLPADAALLLDHGADLLARLAVFFLVTR